MGVLVILEMDGSTDAPPSVWFWDSAEARDGHQSQPEHREALQASGLLNAVTDMRSRVFEGAELKLP